MLTQSTILPWGKGRVTGDIVSEFCFILYETSSHGRNKRVPLDTSRSELFSAVLCRAITWAVSRDAALRFRGPSSQKFKNILSLDIFRVWKQSDSQGYFFIKDR